MTDAHPDLKSTHPGKPITEPAPPEFRHRRLRVQHVVVQPVLVWDDGDELHDGPQVQARPLTLSQISDWAAAVPDEIARIERESHQQVPVSAAGAAPAPPS